jgi:hypothetical protein
LFITGTSSLAASSSSAKQGGTTMANDELDAGFTGTPTEPPTGVRKAATNAVAAVKREAGAAASGAANHPHTASSLVLGIGALAFVIGYAMGRNSVSGGYRYW